LKQKVTNFKLNQL